MAGESNGMRGPDPLEAGTPLDPDESEGLIPTHVETRTELNQWEALNIARAQAEFTGHKQFDLSVESLHRLHRAMFGATWKWAGEYRKSDKNISPYHWTQVSALMHELVLDTRAQYDASDQTPSALDDIALRFHHRLVQIHPWPNGNGRHARLATDLLLASWRRPAFTWGNADPGRAAEARSRYIAALRAADDLDFRLLREFVRS